MKNLPQPKEVLFWGISVYACVYVCFAVANEFEPNPACWPIFQYEHVSGFINTKDIRLIMFVIMPVLTLIAILRTEE